MTCRLKPCRRSAAERPRNGPSGTAAGQVEGESNRALDARAGIDRRLDRHFLGCSLARESPRADVKIFVVLADDNHVDVVGPLPLDRALDTCIKLDGPQVDVLVEVEPEAEQDSLFEDAGGDVGMADGAEQDGVAAAQPLDLGVGQDLPGLQVALAPQVEGDGLESDALDPGDGGEHLEGLGRHLGADAIARHDTELDQNPLRVEHIEAEIHRTESRSSPPRSGSRRIAVTQWL